MSTRTKGVGEDALPAFVGGFRSGTTYLINLLGCHPQLAAWYETKAFCEALRWQYVVKHPELIEQERELASVTGWSEFTLDSVVARMRWYMRLDLSHELRGKNGGKASYEHYVLGSDHTLYDLAEAESAVDKWAKSVGTSPTIDILASANRCLIHELGAKHAKLAGRPIWVNKTPELPRFGRELRESVGRCRIVLVVRNGRDVVLSAKDLNWGGVEKIANYWKGLIVSSREAAIEAPADYLEVRYETLVDAPIPTLDRIFSFLEVEPAGQFVVEEYRRLGGQEVKRPWRRRLESLRGADQALFDSIAGDLMEELGYR